MGITKAARLRAAEAGGTVGGAVVPGAPIWTAEERDAVVEGMRLAAEALKVVMEALTRLVEGQNRLERALKGGAVGQWEEPAVKVGP